MRSDKLDTDQHAPKSDQDDPLFDRIDLTIGQHAHLFDQDALIKGKRFCHVHITGRFLLNLLIPLYTLYTCTYRDQHASM